MDDTRMLASVTAFPLVALVTKIAVGSPNSNASTARCATYFTGRLFDTTTVTTADGHAERTPTGRRICLGCTSDNVKVCLDPSILLRTGTAPR
ncbi:hypothetical protein B0H14DRAFT_3021706, partial [Mycena olivaceomarginata]